MNLDDLRAEHKRERIGPLWLDAIRTVCRSVVQQYPPQIYAAAPTWKDALDDLVQDVVVNALIRDGQAEYILDVAVGMEDFRRLLRRQVRHVLARGRRRTIVDQLLERSARILGQPPFEIVADEPERAWAKSGAREERTAFREAVAIVRAATRVPQHGLERAPTIFATETLRAIIDAISEIHSPLTRRDLGSIYEHGLTPFLPDVLIPRDSPESGPSLLAPEDALQVAESVANVVDALTGEQLQVLRSKLLGLSDADVAAALGVSRPTAAARKREMLEAVGSAMGDVGPDLRDVVMDRLSVRLTLPTFRDEPRDSGEGDADTGDSE